MKKVWLAMSTRRLGILLIALLAVALGLGLAFGVSRSGSEVGAAPGSEEITLSTSAALSNSEKDTAFQPFTSSKAGGRDATKIDETLLSKVILNVDGMSCGGCEATIKSGLADMEGIRDVLVDISAGKTVVLYDNRQLTDVDQIARAITASGYPARVWKDFSPKQVEAERIRALEMSRNYVASVGGWNISRDDFDDELETLKERYTKLYGQDVFSGDRGNGLMDRLKAQVLSGLISEGILLQEIDKAGFTLDPQAIENELEQLAKKHSANLTEFKQVVQENGYEFDTFLKKFEKRLLIDTYVDERILEGVSGEFEKQRAYSVWYNTVRALVDIEYFDKELEGLAKNQSAGGSCCPAGG